MNSKDFEKALLEWVEKVVNTKRNMEADKLIELTAVIDYELMTDDVLEILHKGFEREV